MLTAESGQFGRLDIARAIDVEHQRQDDAVNLLAPIDQPFEIVAKPGEVRRRLRDPVRRQPIKAGRDVAAAIAAEAEDAAVGDVQRRPQGIVVIDMAGEAEDDRVARKVRGRR